MNDKSLDELYEYLDKIKDCLRYAKLYHGKINLVGKLCANTRKVGQVYIKNSVRRKLVRLIK